MRKMSGYELPACEVCVPIDSSACKCIICSMSFPSYTAAVCYNCWSQCQHNCAYCGKSFVSTMLNKKAKACYQHKPNYGDTCPKCKNNSL